MPEEKDLEKMREAIAAYKDDLVGEVKSVWKQAKLDLAHPKKDEVLGGLMARQVRFMSAITRMPEMMSGDLAQIFIRCMADTHITVSWLIKHGSSQDFDNFVEYGLGQEKLYIEHIKKAVGKRAESDPKIKEFLEGSQASIDREIRSDFLSVDVSSWTQKNMRELASEADESTLYNLVYMPNSSVVHGSWNALMKFNLEFCKNPLHKYHRVPSFEDPKPHPEPMDYAMDLMEHTFEVWSKYITGKVTFSNARKNMWGKIDTISKVTNEKDAEGNKQTKSDPVR